MVRAVTCKTCGDVHWADRQHKCSLFNEESDCNQCDGFGCIWNNADPTSGQWVACDCGDTRGHP